MKKILNTKLVEHKMESTNNTVVKSFIEYALTLSTSKILGKNTSSDSLPTYPFDVLFFVEMIEIWAIEFISSFHKEDIVKVNETNNVIESKLIGNSKALECLQQQNNSHLNNAYNLALMAISKEHNEILFDIGFYIMIVNKMLNKRQLLIDFIDKKVDYLW